MKKLGYIIFILADITLFGIAKWVFREEYWKFFILALLLIALNLFHTWFQTFKVKENKKTEETDNE